MKDIKPRVTLFGELYWEILAEGKRLGGAPFNWAFHFNCLEIESHLISAVGKDELGKAIRHHATRHGVHDTYIQERLTPSGTADVSEDLDAPAKIADRVAWDYIVNSPVIEELVERCDLFIFRNIAGREASSRNTLKTLMKQPTISLLDLDFHQKEVDKKWVGELLEMIKFLRVRREDLAIVGDILGLGGTEEKLISTISETSSIPYILLNGEEGDAVFWSEGKFHRHDGYKVKPKDKSGIQEAFLAGFLSRWLNDDELEKSLKMANAVSTFVGSQKGPRRAYSKEWIKQTFRIRD